MRRSSRHSWTSLPQHTPRLCRLFSLSWESRPTTTPSSTHSCLSHTEAQSQCQVSSPQSDLHPQVPGKYSHRNLFISSLLCYCLSWDQVTGHGTWHFSMIQGSHACEAQTADGGLGGRRLYYTFRLRASGDFPAKLRNVPSCTQDSRVGGREGRGEAVIKNHLHFQVPLFLSPQNRTGCPAAAAAAASAMWQTKAQGQPLAVSQTIENYTH